MYILPNVPLLSYALRTRRRRVQRAVGIGARIQLKPRMQQQFFQRWSLGWLDGQTLSDDVFNFCKQKQ